MKRLLNNTLVVIGKKNPLIDSLIKKFIQNLQNVPTNIQLNLSRIS
jgi:hypothetical protein